MSARARTASARSMLVFDVGGTSLRCGVYSRETRDVSGVRRRPTPSIETMPRCDGDSIRARLYAQMESLAAEVLPARTPAGVAVAFPGPVDSRGRVLAAPTVWGDRQGADPVPLRDDLRRLWPSVPVFVLNDVTAAGYRYLDDPRESFCILTISSGIGHKVFIDGKPAVGLRGHGGEIGHLRVDFSPDAPCCDCGERGHLGAVASGRAVVRQAKKLADDEPEAFRASLPGQRVGAPEGIDSRIIAESYRAGDAWTRRLVERTLQPLAQAVAGIHLAVGVGRFVIIGGFAVALGPAFRAELSRHVADCTWKLAQDWDAMIELGRPDDEAGLVGAGRFAELQSQQLDPCAAP